MFETDEQNNKMNFISPSNMKKKNHLSKLTDARVLVQVNLAGNGRHANVEPDGQTSRVTRGTMNERRQRAPVLIIRSKLVSSGGLNSVNPFWDGNLWRVTRGARRSRGDGSEMGREAAPCPFSSNVPKTEEEG